VIPGGSGQVGSVVASAFHHDGHDVVVLSRDPGSAPWPTVRWDGATLGPYEDFVRALYWLIEHDDIDGAVNLASPSPLPNAAFMSALREAWGTRIGLPATAWMLELGPIVLRTETEIILKSRRVIPARLLQEGFSFRHPTWSEAARDLCDEWRRIQCAAGP